MQALSGKASVRILNDTGHRVRGDAERDYKRVLGGLLVQEARLRASRPGADGGRLQAGLGANGLDLLFAWRVVKRVISAIVLAAHGQTLGIGAGRTSRVVAHADRGCTRARRLGHDLGGTVAAS